MMAQARMMSQASMMGRLTKRDIPFSKKNIPIPSDKEYYKKLISKIESLGRRMGRGRFISPSSVRFQFVSLGNGLNSQTN